MREHAAGGGVRLDSRKHAVCGLHTDSFIDGNCLKHVMCEHASVAVALVAGIAINRLLSGLQCVCY
jgi:hypothetical protein